MCNPKVAMIGRKKTTRYARFEDCNRQTSAGMVHVGATTVESIPKDNYSIDVIIMIMACCIWFPTNI